MLVRLLSLPPALDLTQRCVFPQFPGILPGTLTGRKERKKDNSRCLPIPVVNPLGGTCQLPLFRSHDFSPPKKQTRFHDILNCLNTLFFGRPQHLENFVRILAITFSDSLAIFGKNLPADAGKFTPANFFHRKIPGSLPVPITL
jgi:hypothetical protein